MGTPNTTPSPYSSRPSSVSHADGLGNTINYTYKNQYYECFTTSGATGVNIQRITGMRPLITTTLIKQMPYYLQNEPLDVQRRSLASHFHCKCTDCDGPDVEGECLVEKAYYKKYESVRENTIL
mgnify:CR=1 FL=1